MYYVTVRDGRRTILAAGPFARHGDALRTVGPVREIIGRDFPREAAWVSYGTARVRTGPTAPGKLNKRLGLPDRIDALDPAAPQGRWATGDTDNPAGYTRRHDSAANAKRVDRQLAKTGGKP